jgi:hypothetical protein
VATILIMVGCLLAPVSELAVWAAGEISNTGRYVATMEPLAHNPAKYLVKGQSAYRLINSLKIVLPVLTLLLAAGVFVAHGRRRALIGAGLGLAASMLVPAAGLLIFRSPEISTGQRAL